MDLKDSMCMVVLESLTASQTFLRDCSPVVLQNKLASTALDVGKTAAKAVGKKAVEVGKTAALDAGKKLIEKGVTKVLTPKSQSILQKHVGVPDAGSVAKRAQSILSKYINTGAQNINSLIDGSGVQQNAIAIQDLARRLNGSGLKMI